MDHAEQTQGNPSQAQAQDSDKAGLNETRTREAGFDLESGDSSTDEISASMNITSSEDALGLTHNSSAEDDGVADEASAADMETLISEQREDIASSLQQADVDRDLSDELRPKDGAMGASAEASDEGDESGMPTGIAENPGFEDYNPAARKNIKVGEVRPGSTAGQ